MANLNRVLLIGNLTRDPETRHTPQGTAVAELGLAVNRVIPADDGGERREEVTFIDITVWGRQAEVAQQYLTKGRPVFIEGRLQLDTSDDKQSGQKRSKLKVVCEHLQLLGGGRGADEGSSEPHGAAGGQPQRGKAAPPPTGPGPGPGRRTRRHPLLKMDVSLPWPACGSIPRANHHHAMQTLTNPKP
ncbi:MAG TPA: single-stranded DNA-binding protein [Chthoniobacterales bacterium]